MSAPRVVHHIWRCVLIQATLKISNGTPLLAMVYFVVTLLERHFPVLSWMCGLVTNILVVGDFKKLQLYRIRKLDLMICHRFASRVDTYRYGRKLFRRGNSPHFRHIGKSQFPCTNDPRAFKGLSYSSVAPSSPPTTCFEQGTHHAHRWLVFLGGESKVKTSNGDIQFSSLIAQDICHQ